MATWWGLWLGAGIAGAVVDLVPPSAGLGYWAFGLGGIAVFVGAAAAAVLVVRRIDADQQDLGGRLLDEEVGLGDPLPEVP